MADIWIRATRLVGAISIPALVGLVDRRADFVQVVLGPRWSDADARDPDPRGRRDPPVAAHAERRGAAGARQGRDAPPVHDALGRRQPRGVASGLQGDIVGVAACYAVATVLVEPVRAYLTTRALGIPLWRFVRSLSGVAQATALMAARSARRARGARRGGRPGAGAARRCSSSLGGAVYVAACLWRAPEVTTRSEACSARRRQAAADRIRSTRAPGALSSAGSLADRLGRSANAGPTGMGAEARRSYDEIVLDEAAHHEERTGLVALTPRELEVLQMIAFGMTNAEAAAPPAPQRPRDQVPPRRHLPPARASTTAPRRR